MSLKIDFTSHTLNFKKPAGTSRGTLHEKQSWFIKLYESSDPAIYGLGEISTLPGLSLDHGSDFERILKNLSQVIGSERLPMTQADAFDVVRNLVPDALPSVRFALETALLDLSNGGHREVFSNEFYLASRPLPINGLIWMGDFESMKSQVGAKIREGYDCIKIKVGALDFDQECTLLKRIRDEFKSDKVTLRLDANGAFLTNEVLLKLKRLTGFDIHSIEQPIMPKQPEAMALICQKSEIPIALDEELIGIHNNTARRELLEDLMPSYIILKPSLLGGFDAAVQWIDIAASFGIGWWITSALESNVGLNALAQFTASYNPELPQGLGTGQLFTNNIDSPLQVRAGEICYSSDGIWDDSILKY